MQFTPAIAAAVLAFASSAAAAPWSGENGKNGTSVSAMGTGMHTGMPSSARGWSTMTRGATGYSSAATMTHGSGWTSTETKTSASATATATSDPLAALGLSKTQRVFLSDSRVDALNNVLTENDDFFFDFNKAGEKIAPGAGGKVVPANRQTFPALTNTGVGAAIAYLEGCGFNTPHVHPRGTELAVVVEGTIVTSMFPENNVVENGQPREIMTTLNQYDATVFFQGAVHSQFNPSCDPAVFVAAFNSEDFGVGQVAQELFGASNEDLTAAVFGNSISGQDVDFLKGSISKNVALGVEECLNRCGLAKRSVV